MIVHLLFVMFSRLLCVWKLTQMFDTLRDEPRGVEWFNSIVTRAHVQTRRLGRSQQWKTESESCDPIKTRPRAQGRSLVSSAARDSVALVAAQLYGIGPVAKGGL